MVDWRVTGTPKSPAGGRVLVAAVTPLASILGSGLLIIVPVLERTLGGLAVFGAIGVCALAWLIGTAVRHCVRVVEPMAEAGELDAVTRRVDRCADAVIVVAYVVSVALYLRIMAQYVVAYATGSDGQFEERIVACATVVLIIGIGVLRGFAGLDLLDRVSLVAVLILTTVLGVTLAVEDGRALLGDGLRLPPVPDTGLVNVLLVLGGIVITVQGFETVRYLGHEFGTETRVRASRVAQLVAASIYVGIVAVATPVMGIGTPAGADNTLLDITGRVAPLLALPLALSAVLSQLSAAVADTAAADGNLRALSTWTHGPRSYLAIGVAAILLAATVPTYTIVAVASRAFAAYYALQAVLALRTSRGLSRRLGYGALAVVMAAVVVLARPAG